MNFDTLDILRGMDAETVDLIYFDPPLNTNKSYKTPIGSSATRTTRFLPNASGFPENSEPSNLQKQFYNYRAGTEASSVSMKPAR